MSTVQEQTGYRLTHPLPDAVAAVAREHFGEPDGYRVVIPGDILPDGSFGDTWFICTDTSLGVIGYTAGTPPVLVIRRVIDAADQLSLIPGLNSGVVEIT